MDMTLPVFGITIGAWPVAAAGCAVVAVGSAVYLGYRLQQHRRETAEIVATLGAQLNDAETARREEAERRQRAEQELARCANDLAEHRQELRILRTEMAQMAEAIRGLKAQQQAQGASQ